MIIIIYNFFQSRRYCHYLNVAKWQSGKVAVSVLSCVLLAFTSEFGGILQKSAPNAMLKFGGSKYYS